MMFDSIPYRDPPRPSPKERKPFAIGGYTPSIGK